MLELLSGNYLLLLNLLIPFGIGLYLRLTHKEYSLKEFCIQMLITIIILIGSFYIGYRGSDIYTKSYKSTEVKKFVFEEEYTEKVTYSESYTCGNSTCHRTKIRYDKHEARYYIESKYSSSSINKSMYNKAANEFATKVISTSHFGQSSYGDGKTFVSIPNRLIVHSDYDSELNYIYASKSNIIKSNEFKDLEKQYKSELQKYPKLISDTTQYGNMNFSRVINSHLINSKTANKLQLDLELLSINFPGNPIIYLTTATSVDFTYVIKGYYRDSQFNDAMLVVSVKDNTILWTAEVSLSKSAEFKIYSTNLTNSFDDLISKYQDVLKLYWKKPNLDDYKYLANEIDLPLWYELLVIMLNIICSIFAFRYMLKNTL